MSHLYGSGSIIWCKVKHYGSRSLCRQGQGQPWAQVVFYSGPRRRRVVTSCAGRFNLGKHPGRLNECHSQSGCSGEERNIFSSAGIRDTDRPARSLVTIRHSGSETAHDVAISGESLMSAFLKLWSADHKWSSGSALVVLLD